MHKLLDKRKRKVHYLVAICMKKNQKFNGLARFYIIKRYFFVFRCNLINYYHSFVSLYL